MERIPARKLSDIELPETSYKADFDIADRYSGFATEVVRFSLLGIAGYGFLISEIVMKVPGTMGSLLHQNKVLLLAGIVCLGISLALALLHRFLSTSCLFYQIRILRTLRRFENLQWSEAEKKEDEHYLKAIRKTQKETSNRCHIILMTAVAALAIGLVLVATIFFIILLNLPSPSS